jgi:EspG family
MTGPLIRLTSTELLAGWESLDLGEPPFLLRLRRPGHTQATRHEAQRLLHEAMTALAARGLADGGQPSAALAHLLRTLAHADYHLDIRFTDPSGSGRPILGLGAVAGAHGVVVVSNDGAGPLDLRAVDGSRVAATLLNLLGEVRPGIGSPVNIASAVLDDAVAATPDGGVWSLADQLRERGIPRQEASSLARMCTGINFGGQLGATARFAGPDRRGPWVIGFLRGEAGYFLQLRRGATVTVCPTDTSRLMHRWRELVEHLQPAVR